jgi:PAS domain-containing protein
MQSRALRLVTPDPGVDHGPAEWVWFCGHCGERRDGTDPPAPDARVCSSCGLGLLLETQADLAPAPGAPFLLVDDRLRVHGMSAAAERLLGLTETDASGRPIGEMLVAPDAEATRSGGLAGLVADVASGGDAPTRIFVRPWNTFGVRLRAQISACGPPRAALIVLGGSAPLRAVG